jgi:hypothetical protein
MDVAKLQKMAGSVRTGGKGSVRRCARDRRRRRSPRRRRQPGLSRRAARAPRRAPPRRARARGERRADAPRSRTPRAASAPSSKKKAVHKTTSTDDKRLQNTLKRLGVNTIPGIEEVNIFKDDTVIHFTNPKGARRGAAGNPTRPQEPGTPPPARRAPC